jgi:serine/threonine-protein kinase
MSQYSQTPPQRCRVALGGVSTAFRGEMTGMLRRRLCAVALLAFAPLALFLIRNLFDPSQTDSVSLGLHATATVIVGLIAAALWPQREWTECQLRRAELALLGATAGFFGWLQTRMFREPEVFRAEAVCLEGGLDVVRLWIDASALRWFFLIVIYGLLIPGSWKRCLAVAVSLALLPIGLTALGAWATDHLCPGVLYGLFDLAILLGTGVAVAVFGSYRMDTLKREAIEAQQLGQYHLGKRLGGGGMGEVYEARHRLLRRRCAVKLIRPDRTHDPSVLDRFEREVQAMAGLTHPNSVEVYDYGHADDGTFYYVMEYLPGMTLEELVAQHGPLPPERAIHFLRQVCRSLREAHGVGLLHRDVKPGNIIACERGGEQDVAKLLDYGLVQTPGLGDEARKLTVQGMILGSPPFMPPEQATGRADVDARADIYSLGGVGYFLLTGHPPFERETPMEMLLAHAYEPPVPPSSLRPDVPADLEAVLLRCLAKKPEDRYPDVAALEAALASCESAGMWTEEDAAAWWRSIATQSSGEDARPTLTEAPATSS